MHTGPTLSASDLLEHAEFLQTLARRLVGDEHAAEDLVQEARLSALRSGQAAPARAWLARVVQRLASNARRGAGRRARREREAARSEALAPPDEVRARLELQEQVVAAVRALEEPYRTVVYLRFYEGLMPREIAARTGAPVATVKTRLQRAIERLRRELDDSFDGDRRAWCAVLAPLAALGDGRGAGATGAGALLLGGLTVNAKLLLVAGSAAAAALLWSVWPTEAAHPVAGHTPVARAGELERPPAPAPVPAATPPAREAVALTPAAASAVDAPAPSAWTIRGRVSDPSGAPLAEAAVELRIEPSTERVIAHSDADGEYTASIELPTGLSTHAELAVRGTAILPGFAPGVQRLNRRSPTETEQRLDFELAPARHVVGTVVDQRGEPVAAVNVALVDDRGSPLLGTRSRENGAFAIRLDGFGGLEERAPLWVLAGSVKVGCALAGPFDWPAAPGEDVDVGTLVLEPRAVLEGVASFPDGRRLANTRVYATLVTLAPDAPDPPDEAWFLTAEHTATGLPARLPRGSLPRFRELPGIATGSTFTDERGRFRFEGLVAGSYDLSFPQFGARGHAPTVGPFDTGAFAEVVVEGRILRVRVVDGDGLPVPGARVVAMGAGGGTISETAGLEGEWRHAVEPGTWRISASMQGARTAAREIQVLRDVFDYDVQLELDFAVETGSVRVVVADGARAFGVDLFGDEPTALSDYRGLSPDADGLLPPVPVGDYLARAHFSPLELGYRFPAEGFVSVRAGETATLRLEPRVGGRLALDIDAEIGEGRGDAAVELDDGLGNPPVTVGNLFRARPDGLEITTPGFGESGLSDLLEPGAYTLRVRADGYAEFVRPVEVRAGETVELSVRLRPL